MEKKTGYQWTVYQPKTARWKTVSISNDLYQEVKEYKTLVKQTRNYKKMKKCDSRGNEVEGHFLFDRMYDSIYKKFRASWECYKVFIEQKTCE